MTSNKKREENCQTESTKHAEGEVTSSTSRETECLVMSINSNPFQSESKA